MYIYVFMLNIYMCVHDVCLPVCRCIYALVRGKENVVVCEYTYVDNFFLSPSQSFFSSIPFTQHSNHTRVVSDEVQHQTSTRHSLNIILKQLNK